MEMKRDEGVGIAELFSVNEAGRRLALSPWTIRAHVRGGSIKSIRCGRRVLIPAFELSRIQREGLPSLRGDSKKSGLIETST
jgi:excisionase family DNA binding protein